MLSKKKKDEPDRQTNIYVLDADILNRDYLQTETFKKKKLKIGEIGQELWVDNHNKNVRTNGLFFVGSLLKKS